MNKLSIVCLNCFGIPLPVKRKLRFTLIADELYKLSPDIIALQEVFVWTDRNILINKLKNHYNIYPEKFLPFGSGGLITFVKKSIETSYYKFNRFKEQGNKSFISIPDGIAGKGYQTINIKHHNNNLLFVNCHMMCQYNKSKYLISAYSRQLKELIVFLNGTRDMIVLVGDLNNDPDSCEILKLKSEINLYEKININMYTVDPLNLNRGAIMNIFGNGNSYRTDYTFVSAGIKLLKQDIIFDKPVLYNGRKYNLSDHYGVYSELTI